MVNARVVNGFIVYRARDLIEGRAPSVIHAVTVDKQDAELCAKGDGIMGYPGRIKPAKVVVFELASGTYCTPLDGCFKYPVYPERELEIRKQALAKLSPEEKRALGVNEDGEE